MPWPPWQQQAHSSQSVDDAIYHDDAMRISLPLTITYTERCWGGYYASCTERVQCIDGSRPVGGTW
eukprot:1219125-Pyramimonas_sp.AAC.1